MANVSMHIPAHQRHQQGLALMVALIVLVAMSMAGIALMRSVDTASLIAGNLAFRQGATLSGDAGVEAARTFLLGAGNNNLGNDQTADGYYATSQDNLDLTGNTASKTISVAWPGTAGTGSAPVCLAKDAAGNTACYIIHRLCNDNGPLDAATCSTQTTARAGSSLGATRPMATYQERGWKDVATMAYYRVTVRVAGPRNNVSYIQAFILI